MQNLKDKATRQVLLDLRKKISRIIADAQTEEPEGVEMVEEDVEMPEEGMGELGEEIEEEEPNELEEEMRRFMNPKPRERKAGTATMIASSPSKRAPPAFAKGKQMGRPRRDAV